MIRCAGACAVAAAVFLTGCSSSGGLGGSGADVVASDASAISRTGFLSDYARLRPAPGGEGMLCWRDASVDWKRYDKVLIERIQVYLKPGAKPNPIDPTDLKMLLDYFHGALVKAITPEAQIVNTAGPDVLRVRIALTDLASTNTWRASPEQPCRMASWRRSARARRRGGPRARPRIWAIRASRHSSGTGPRVG